MKIQKESANFVLSCLLFCLVGLGLFLYPCAAEEAVKPSSASETGIAFEQALTKIEAKKEAELNKLAAQLSGQLEQAVDKWITQRSESRQLELNNLIEQNWEKLALTENISPLHYDYYLKGYVFGKGQSDIIKTDSLTSPYKGRVVIIEKLYVEKYHPANISNIDPYFFTVTGNITLNVEFGQPESVVTLSDYRVVAIENDCPENIKRMRF